MFPEGCGSAAEGKHDPNKVPVEVDGNSNNKGVEDATDNVEESDAKSTITKVIGELVNIKPDQSEVVVEEQVCCCYDEDDGSLQVFEEGNDENPKVEEGIDEDPRVEEGYDDGNAQEVPVRNENVLFGDSKVSTTGESFPNDIPAPRLADEIEVKLEPDKISKVLAHEAGNNEDNFLIQTPRKPLTTIIQTSMKIQGMNLFMLQ